MTQHYLITGGAGFIGSNLVESLLEAGQRVRVLDNLATSVIENLEAATQGDMSRIEFFWGDIRDLEVCREAVKGVDFVLHQAALGSVPRSVDDPLTTHRVNATGTLNMLVASKDEGVKRFVSASSSSVYGNPENAAAPKVETMPTRPLSPYAVSKVAGENYARVFWELYGLETVSLRYFNVFGPRQDPHSQYSAVIPKFLYALIKGERPLVHGDGLQSRDFSYVDNVVAANLLACRAGDGFGREYNVACGSSFTLIDLFGKLSALLGSKVEPEFGPQRPGDVRHSLADVSLAGEVLGYRPEVDFDRGLSLIVERAKRGTYLGGKAASI